MEGYGPETYGDRIADVYETIYPDLDTEGAVERLVELAAGGPALELAIGTGRLALPLVERGIELHGIDASEAMVAKLREKPGGDRIPVTLGDFADVAVDGRYRLIFVAFNTFFALLTQEDQVRCSPTRPNTFRTTASSCSRPSFPTSPALTVASARRRTWSRWVA
jgi:SAM-dependent methyltransferase